VISSTKIRVRYKDTDTMGVVYYGNYLTYFEVARVEYLRQQGTTIAEINAKLWIPVVEAAVTYVRPARLDELIEARCWIGARRRASFRFDYELLNEAGERLCTGSTLHACQDPATGKVLGVPAWLAGLMPVVSAE
jgi:acyl-CoA thioester hydrolase